MFTGLIEALGTVEAVVPAGAARRFTIAAPFAPELAVGESVAVDGACQTVTGQTSAAFTVEAVPETLRRTRLGSYRPGQTVNLERALRLSDRLGGHLVSGHVDCTGRVARLRPDGESRILTIEYPSEYVPLLVDKGSVTLDGVSLTVVEARGRQFSVALIPHTQDHTTLGRLRTNEAVNIEFDLIAKYIWKFTRREGGAVWDSPAGEERVTR